MGIRMKKRTLTRFKKRFAKPQNWILIGSVVILVVVMSFSFDDTFSVGPEAYKPLLNTIAKGESGGNYNAHFGSPANSKVRFTDMTIGEVLSWQEDFVSKGNVSSAVGKYQIIQPTLVDITSKMNITHDAKFDEALQDKIAIALIERRGSLQYVNSEMSREEFAANLAKEWAAFPSISGANPNESYYAGDGVNKSNITPGEVYAALDALQKSAIKND